MSKTDLDNDGSGRDTPEQWTPFLIGVGGGTASGKSTVCSKIMETLGQDNIANHKRRVFCIAQDSFYKELNTEQHKQVEKGNYDFDHPDAIDHQLMSRTLQNILESKVVQIPVWDFKTHSRKKNESITVYPADVFLIEGILIFYFPEVRDLLHMKLFVDTDSDIRLSRRVTRDVKEYGRELDSVLSQYTFFVKPAFEEFCQPTKKYADIIIPRGADNEVAIGLIVQTIREYLRSERTLRHSSIHNAPRSRYFSDSFISTSPTNEHLLGTSPVAFNYPVSPTKRTHH